MHLPRRFGILSCLILWRLTSVILVQTAHVPDEYWQSLEVAHRIAFGYGHFTWEWTAMIRSYMYPFLISILYRVLAVLSLDFAWLLTTLPRVFQALLVAYADYRFYRWTKCKWMLFVLCTNWYWYYCATRTLINAVETACTIVALSIFPWRDGCAQDNTSFLWLVGFLCMTRPTAAIVWLPLCVYHISTSTGKGTALLGQYTAICSVCFAISVLVDSSCYGTLVITPLKFFQVNALGSIGNTYGEQHTLWYFFAGLPVLLGLYCIPFLIAVWRILKYSAYLHREAVALATVVWSLTVYSLLSHKEFRFVLPLLPLMVYASGACTYRLKIRVSEFRRKSILALLICSNLAPGLYFSVIHQRGALDMMALLRDKISDSSSTAPTDTLILTPCHATPLYSHLHVNAPIRFLTCEPNLGNVEDYIDEADRFFADPALWLDDNYTNNSSATPPAYVIAFDRVANKIGDFLRAYRPIAKMFHTHFPQSNYGEYLLLYKHAAIA